MLTNYNMKKKASIYYLNMYDDQGEYLPRENGIPLKEGPLNLIYSVPVKTSFYVVAYGMDDAYKIMAALKKSLKLKKRIGEANTGNYYGVRAGKTYLARGIYYGPHVNTYDETEHHKLKMAFEDFDSDKLIAEAHSAIIRTKGKEYAPTATEIQGWLDKNVLHNPSIE